MGEIHAPIGEIIDLPPVWFTTSGAIYDPSPAPTATFYDSAGNATVWALTKLGTGATTRFYVKDFTQAAAITGTMVYATTDSAADAKKFGESIRVGASAAVDLTPVLSAIAAVPAAVWNALTAGMTTPGSIGKAWVDFTATLLSRTASGVQFINPVDQQTGLVKIIQGQDYLVVDGGVLHRWIEDDWIPYSLTTAQSVKWHIRQTYKDLLSDDVHVVANNEIDIQTFIHTVTAKLTPGAGGTTGSESTLQIWAKLNADTHGGAEKRLVNARIVVSDDIRS